LDIQVDAIENLAASKRGRMFGFAGVTLGLVCAYIGITLSLISEQVSSVDAGFYYGAVGAFCGVCFGLIGLLSNKRKSIIT
jgi:hypothetical protein